ncbi:MAG TPA: hypothetical protein VJN43_01020 [Bryobacteraceae bacterium]|nr:hypothetical protein [Bryobacteraceae bacterium]
MFHESLQQEPMVIAHWSFQSQLQLWNLASQQPARHLHQFLHIPLASEDRL